MVPTCSYEISRVSHYSGYYLALLPFVYWTFTFYGVLSQTLQLDFVVHVAVQTPKVFLLLVWPLPRSLATTSGISVDFFSSPYLDVSVQAVPYVYLCIQYTLTDSSSAGFPHSEIHGSLSAFD